MIQQNFIVLLVPYDRPKDQENGQSHVTEAIILFEVKTAMFTVYISLAAMVQRKGFKYKLLRSGIIGDAVFNELILDVNRAIC